MNDLAARIRRDREADGPTGLRSDTCAAGAPGVAVRMDPRVVDGQMRRIAQEADAGTITPPVMIEPVLEPHPADHRLAAANALHHIRKARGR